MYTPFLENKMSLKVIPTNIGGFNLPFAQLQGPLSSLFQNQNPKNLVYPADLGSNPAMGHAVLFEVFDYKTGFGDATTNLLGDVTSKISASSIAKTFGGTTSQNIEAAKNLGVNAVEAGNNYIKETIANPSAAVSALSGPAGSAARLALAAVTAPSYQRQKKNQLATIALYMPDTLNVTYNSNYGEVNLTDSLGAKGFIGSAISDAMKSYDKGGIDEAQKILIKEYGTAYLAGKVGNLLGANIGDLLQQAAGLYVNPQTQLLYRGVDLRTFTLEFIFTPKSAQEAKSTKDICDSFAYYSLPDLAGAGGGTAGQFLTPPQLFTIKFKFLGKNDILGSVSSVFSSALSNSGLGFLTTSSPTNTITNGNTAKIMTINECVLQNVNVDYAPNGWAAYSDGHPVQTRLMLTFKEMSMPTKQSIDNSRVQNNYNNAQYMGSAIDNEVSSLGGTREDFMTGSNGFGNYGE